MSRAFNIIDNRRWIGLNKYRQWSQFCETGFQIDLNGTFGGATIVGWLPIAIEAKNESITCDISRVKELNQVYFEFHIIRITCKELFIKFSVNYNSPRSSPSSSILLFFVFIPSPLPGSFLEELHQLGFAKP
jgi:hypothetical protein